MPVHENQASASKSMLWEDLRRGSSDPMIPDLPFHPNVDEAVLKAAVDKVLSAQYPKPKANRAAR
ncbi:MAG: hypothetical protein IT165_17985 [Bryobacterales bacterium]|nr:hypothetical protein [Bryobacterales bacterium]